MPSILRAKIIKVKKRSGDIVDFDVAKIVNAVNKAINAVDGKENIRTAKKVADRVVLSLNKKFKKGDIPGVEEIQDLVEEALINQGMAKVAKGYILYRSERAKVRAARKFVPKNVRRLAEESKKYFRNALSEFIYYRTYSRWIPDQGRRETWIETVARYVDFMKENLGKKLTESEYKEIEEAILTQKVMPSMRLMWSAGPAAKKTNVSAYNCSYIAPSKIEDFAEVMYLSMCGAGVGFSVESQTIQQLPIIKFQTNKKVATHIIKDSKEGWGDALTLGLKAWYEGSDVDFDFSEIRPAGSRLLTMGGQSSGPEPLRSLLNFARKKILSRQGKRLSNIDAHDILCKIGEVVVMGGVRRSAMISLSDLDDQEMRHAKEGQFYLLEPHRQMANNSSAYNKKPSNIEFVEEWLALARNGTGERGIFNRGGLKHQLPQRRWKKFGKYWHTAGTNPCGEIVLRSKEFCNLSEVVCRAEDTKETLVKKARLASILGTYQSTLTNFPYLSSEWKKNCEEERLLGVSLTGQWDCPAVRDTEILQAIKEEAVRVNFEYAKKFGINPSTCVTCVKPSGTVSQLVDASSGMHPRHAKYYIRRIRISASDPLFHMLRDQKAKYYPEVGQLVSSASTFILEFPVKAPDVAIVRDDISALDQLEHWKMVKENYTEHNPSVTISVGEDEWLTTANWLYGNWDILGGLSFLPRNNHAYAMAPYEEIDEKRYNELAANMPKVDFSQILYYEKEDATQGSKELACVGGVCEIEEATKPSAVKTA
ncbi:MAG: ribonucleoside-triphosphate reductase [Candidatus Spechtbacteria bacterium RIFCSPHIGHO2_02_FULL_43_15b]|uniref:Ribonucleoside-triphosphate reductase n=1 Tax=Candidatus Spechtbacteria bacterium RIFCSPHIGHO2_01_FULL_43_30 TaxID=1802158 RepID=A0A1G2H8D9_9BACT|nr:MAG: ribonucleoside-triphosphate reductase [Candidatus Spechtbacteria bacterium RIFCSPHIGHO2_01_FULL_43_30]OGZ59738.1 MAG: ribonucleoside-triphosphate reductase [Candidatus Spechtbacteria bacterium RIFCSPHIGHO2_02_FULL_43_15b]